ncbi:MAG TPA: protein translocase subunit SecF, partial [Bacteroidetes bacterium]|nr:protein translocase subunit SecF [Bacteroidota bacterium]
MRIFENTNFDFLGKRTRFYLISAVIIVIGFIIL